MALLYKVDGKTKLIDRSKYIVCNTHEEIEQAKAKGFVTLTQEMLDALKGKVAKPKKPEIDL